MSLVFCSLHSQAYFYTSHSMLWINVFLLIVLQNLRELLGLMFCRASIRNPKGVAFQALSTRSGAHGPGILPTSILYVRGIL